MQRWAVPGLVLSLLLALPAALSAQPAQPRQLDVPAGAAWQHAQTRMILPSRVVGLSRGELRDLGEGEMDVVAQYAGGDDGTFVTVYLFRTAAPDASLWFDRALTAILTRPEYGVPSNAPLPTATPFQRPGATVASGLRVTLDLNASGLRSSGIAVAPLGAYLLKVRISSSSLDRAALDERLARFIEGLRWPAPAANERAAVPIQQCSEPLRLRNARLVRSDMASALMDAMGGTLMQDAREGEPPVYCREPGATLQYGAYRPGASRERYFIALADAGIGIVVGEAIDLSALTGGGGGGRRFSMTMMGRNSTSVLPSFNRLPPPEQAVSAAFGNRGPVISVSTDSRPERQ